MTIYTASDWDNCRDPKAMLDLLTIAEQEWMSASNWARGLVPSLRKMRLFVFATASKSEGIESARNGYGKWEDGKSFADDPEDDNLPPIRNARSWIQSPEGSITADDQANILRDIIGNPFSPVMISKLKETSKPKDNRMFGNLQIVDPPWLTPQVVSLAQAAYEERDTKCTHCHGRKKLMYDSIIDNVTDAMPSYLAAITEPSHEYRVLYNQEYKNCHVCDGTGNGANNSSLDPVRLMVLADALEEAGCPIMKCPECPVFQKVKVTVDGYYEQDVVGKVIAFGKARKECKCGGTGSLPHPILTHLRSRQPHYRGCHVLDSLLGYE